jgi:hypothetical protein
MLEALIGLAGIIVGAALTGFVELLRDWRQERALAEGTVRVLALDLIELESQVQWTLGEGAVRFSKAEVARITDTWLQHRNLLARKFTPDEWATVARVFQTTLVWGDRDGDPIASADRQHLEGWLIRIDRAQAVLDRWPKAE